MSRATPSYPVVQQTIANGLRVVVSEDRACSSATVHVRYEVGSRHEARHRTGMAHLVEHLMYRGSRRVRPGGHAALIQACGGDFNAAVGADQTDYYQRVPAAAVDLALVLEAERMAALTEGLTQEQLDAQRRVITQERHQRHGTPFCGTETRLLTLAYPSGHPYSHPAAGFPGDLDAATLDEVAAFVRAFYSPGNAVLSVAGNVTAQQVLTSAARYFGAVPAGPRIPRVPLPLLEPAVGHARDDAVEQVPYGITTIGFLLPPDNATSPELLACGLALRALAGGTGRHVHGVLVDELHLAHRVTARTRRRAGNSLGTITVHAMPGVRSDVIETALTADLGLAGLLGLDEQELAAARAGAERKVLAALSGSASRAALLAHFTAAFGDPALAGDLPARLNAVTPGQVQEAAARWLSPQHAVTVTTFPPNASAGSRSVRSEPR